MILYESQSKDVCAEEDIQQSTGGFTEFSIVLSERAHALTRLINTYSQESKYTTPAVGQR